MLSPARLIAETKARLTLMEVPGLFPDGLVKAFMPPPPFTRCLLLRITKLLTRPPGDLTTWASVTPLYLTDYLYNSTLSQLCKCFQAVKSLFITLRTLYFTISFILHDKVLFCPQFKVL